VRENMETVLQEVQDGTFAREWITEDRAGRPAYGQRRAAAADHEIERVGAELRELFAWSDETDGERDGDSEDRDRGDDTDDRDRTTPEADAV